MRNHAAGRGQEPVAPARATGTSLARRWRGGRGTGPRHPPGPRAASIPPLPARLDLEKTVFFMPPGRRVSRASEGRDSVLVSAPGCFHVIALHRAPILTSRSTLPPLEVEGASRPSRTARSAPSTRDGPSVARRGAAAPSHRPASMSAAPSRTSTRGWDGVDHMCAAAAWAIGGDGLILVPGFRQLQVTTW